MGDGGGGRDTAALGTAAGERGLGDCAGMGKGWGRGLGKERAGDEDWGRKGLGTRTGERAGDENWGKGWGRGLGKGLGTRTGERAGDEDWGKGWGRGLGKGLRTRAGRWRRRGMAREAGDGEIEWRGDGEGTAGRGRGDKADGAGRGRNERSVRKVGTYVLEPPAPIEWGEEDGRRSGKNC